MKRFAMFLVVPLLVVFAVPAMAVKSTAANNSVSVAGDIVKDGHLMIDVDWTVDTAKYPGLSKDTIRKKVRDEIMDKMLAKIMAATKGINISYDTSRFTTLKENHNLIKKRPNGTRLYTLDLEIEFEAEQAPVSAPAATPKPSQKDDKGFTIQQRWDNDI